MKKQFGKYRLLDKIATGGMAEIWLARQTGVKGFEKLVVLKKILPEFTKNKEFVDMFLNEARVAAMLTHSNIVQIYDLGSVKNIYFIAMEYIFGLSLDQLLIKSVKKKSPLPLQFSCHIISQAATGLHYAHNMKDIYGVSMNIVHRDISPQNILVSYEGIAKVVDFGIAKANTRSNEKTQAGKIKGKVSYMSPEQIKGEKLDGRSDVFALAIVLYEITTGKRLFPNVTNPFEMMDLIINREFIPPHILNPKYPKILSKIIMKALEKDKSRRYQTALGFSKDLERFLKSFNTPVFSNDVSIWLKELFKTEIRATKERHENLLWEDDDNISEEEEETTNLLQVKKTPPKFNKPKSRDLYVDEEETIIGNQRPPFKEVEQWTEDDDDETVMAKPGFNINDFDDSTMKRPPKKGNLNDSFDFDDSTMKRPPKKKVINNVLDFPDEDDFPKSSNYDDEENTNLLGNYNNKSEEESTVKSGKKRSRRRSSTAKAVKPKKSINKKSNHSSPKKKEKKRKKKEKKKSFLGGLIYKIILLFLLYSIYFMGIFGYKYYSAEERFQEIIENAVEQADPQLNIDEGIKLFCRTNEYVKCIKKTFKSNYDPTNQMAQLSLSYEVTETFLWEIMKYLPPKYQRKWIIKHKFESKFIKKKD